jgi:tRNA pseudouridine synthase D (TruD)
VSILYTLGNRADAIGFINYFGTQRVGSVQLDAVMPHTIGKAILQGNLSAAVKLILQPLQPSRLQPGNGNITATATATAAVPTTTATVAASLEGCEQVTTSTADSSTSISSNSGSAEQGDTSGSSTTAAAETAQQQHQQQQQQQQQQPTAAAALLWDYLEGR